MYDDIDTVGLFCFTKKHAEWLSENVKGDWWIHGQLDTEYDDTQKGCNETPWYVSVTFDIEADAIAFKMWVD